MSCIPMSICWQINKVVITKETLRLTIPKDTYWWSRPWLMIYFITDELGRQKLYRHYYVQMQKNVTNEVTNVMPLIMMLITNGLCRCYKLDKNPLNYLPTIILVENHAFIDGLLSVSNKPSISEWILVVFSLSFSSWPCHVSFYYKSIHSFLMTNKY